MIIALCEKLREAEELGNKVVRNAGVAYAESIKSEAPLAETAALEVSRHELALGAIRTALAHIETIISDQRMAAAPAAGS